MSATRSHRDEPALATDPPSNVLLQAPSLSEGGMSICPHIGKSGDTERNLLFVSLSGTPERRLDTWRRHGGLPEKVAVITVDNTRSAAATGAGRTIRDPDGTALSTTTLSDPGDLTGIGIKMSKCLSAWEDEDARTQVCFDSLTTLLQYVDIEQVFQYLHVTSKRIEAVGGTAHYHIDPNAHDDKTLATIESLFSDVYRYDTETDSWSEV